MGITLEIIFFRTDLSLASYIFDRLVSFEGYWLSWPVKILAKFYLCLIVYFQERQCILKDVHSSLLFTPKGFLQSGLFSKLKSNFELICLAVLSTNVHINDQCEK